LCDLADKDKIKYGLPYIITKNINVFRYIRKSDNPEMVILGPANDKYDEIEVEIANIEQLFIIKGKIQRNLL